MNMSSTPPGRTTRPIISSSGTQNIAKPLSDAEQKQLMTFNHISYLLYVLSYFTAGILWIVPIVMNYAKRREAEGTWLATHFDWQIKTFWYTLIWFVAGIIVLTIALTGLGVSIFAESAGVAFGSFGLGTLGGGLILFAILWHLYRIVRGWIALADHRPVP